MKGRYELKGEVTIVKDDLGLAKGEVIMVKGDLEVVKKEVKSHSLRFNNLEKKLDLLTSQNNSCSQMLSTKNR
ncbi:hypothetical protein J2Z83_002182 [Virgibacillus natechei]|uniref:Uncharacterized protein n=1 Tax=Virgibacillus natechei TaxID=1216297 RepID=A0ABS4IGJ5_9BACI|nr:hypothetical protein [Virgibacillus natechei]MBP1970066.1 hypothetical protein [Virgibacillus natechei]UZD14147.1 hypothetical protein OLD84_06415 [Virgibacillus natechei]